MTDKEREETQTMIREAIRVERQRIGRILRSSRVEVDWDSVNGSRPDFGMTMVAIAEEIEKED